MLGLAPANNFMLNDMLQVRASVSSCPVVSMPFIVGPASNLEERVDRIETLLFLTSLPDWQILDDHLKHLLVEADPVAARRCQTRIELIEKRCDELEMVVKLAVSKLELIRKRCDELELLMQQCVSKLVVMQKQTFDDMEKKIVLLEELLAALNEKMQKLDTMDDEIQECRVGLFRYMVQERRTDSEPQAAVSTNRGSKNK